MINAQTTLANLVNNRVLDLEDFYSITLETKNRLNLQGKFTFQLASNIKKAFKGLQIDSEIGDNGFVELRVTYNDTKIRITLT
jgi:hypothetical protein